MALVDDVGRVLSNRSVVCEKESVKGFFSHLKEPAQVVVEATSNWYWFCNLLEEMEIPVLLAHPLKMKAIAAARIKTDKLDAATLAHLLRADLVPRAHLSSHQARLDRELLRHRTVLVRLRTGAKNRIHALLAKENLVYPKGGLFTQHGRQWLASLALQPVHRAIVDRMLILVQVLEMLIEQASKEIRVRAEDDRAARLLCSIPGVSYYTALLIAAEIDGVHRFPDARHLCSYAGRGPLTSLPADEIDPLASSFAR